MAELTRIAFILAAALAAAAAPAPAQRTVDPNCSDDRGVDRCSPEQQRRTRQLFGVRSIEDHRAAGDEIRRVFYVDGYGRDIVLIAFVRAAGREPTAWVHYPEREGEARSEPFQAPVPLAVWNDVIESSANFHRRFEVPARERTERAGEEQEMIICLHSWVYTMEAVNRPEYDGQPQIRRKVEDACENGPGEMFAQRLDEIARSLFPHCAALDITQHRNAAMALSACRILSGDRLAAAQVLNSADPFTNVQGREDTHLLARVFDDDATIDWAGEQHRGGYREAAEFWTARLQGAEGRTIFYIHAVEGVNGARARLAGSLVRPAAAVAGRREGYESATVEQIWIGDEDEWLIERAVVGPWRPERVD